MLISTKIDRLTNKFYGECSDYYDLIYPDHINYSVDFFNKVNKILKKYNVRKILDASCGAGHDMLTLLDKGYLVDGNDICAKMVVNTNKNLILKGYNNSLLFNYDVRNIADKIGQNKYDAVVFRGNTFSNIPPDDVSLVINQLNNLLKKNGLLLIDYRNGLEQFSTKSSFEYRGSGYIKDSKLLFISFYRFINSSNINKPYTVNAYIWLWKNFSLKPVLKNFLINSFYVDEKKILKCLKLSNLKYEFINIKTQGLPFLKSLLIFKK